MSKYEKFWDWFSKNEQKYYDNIENEEIRDELFDELNSELYKVGDLYFEFSPIFDEKYREFIISANGIVENFPEVIKLVEAAPKYENWRIIAFRQRVVDDPEAFVVVQDGYQYGYNDVYFRYAIVDGKLGIELNVRDLDLENESIVTCVFILLDFLLGEYDSSVTISWLDWKKLYEEDIDELTPLIELRDLIDDLKEKGVLKS